MKTIQSIFVGILLLAAFSSCKKDDEDQAIMTMTVTVDYETYERPMFFYLKGAGTAVIDWGDGSPFDTITLSATENIRCQRSYSNLIDREIKIYGNDIQSLDYSQNSFNKLTGLDVSRNKALKTLKCNNNLLTVLDVSRNRALTHLECSSNRLTSLDVSKNTALTELACNYNRLTSLDVSRNTALTSLNCSYNQLTVLDVSKNTALTLLSCSNNQLTVLDVRKNIALDALSCGGNRFTALDVSNNIALEYLSTFGSPLERLDVSRNTALKTLWCVRNQLSVAELDALFHTLHSNTILGKIVDVTDNPGTDACNPKIATEKGWIVDTE